MRKITVFNGTINGEKFTNVADYNARMNELIAAGETDIQASSSTSIKTVEDECPASAVDEDLSFYPYVDKDDPYYLDLLVTNDHQTNVEALRCAEEVLAKCWNHITEALEDNEVTQETRREYLNDIQSCIESFKKDRAHTESAVKVVKEKREKLLSELATLANEESVLNDALPVIDKFIEFYTNVESATLEEIANHNVCKHDGCTCGGTCTCGKEKNVETTCTETQPTRTANLADIIGHIFGPGWNVYDRKRLS